MLRYVADTPDKPDIVRTCPCPVRTDRTQPYRGVLSCPVVRHSGRHRHSHTHGSDIWMAPVSLSLSTERPNALRAASTPLASPPSLP
jgi:hypothetical protein